MDQLKLQAWLRNPAQSPPLLLEAHEGLAHLERDRDHLRLLLLAVQLLAVQLLAVQLLAVQLHLLPKLKRLLQLMHLGGVPAMDLREGFEVLRVALARGFLGRQRRQVGGLAQLHREPGHASKAGEAKQRPAWQLHAFQVVGRDVIGAQQVARLKLPVQRDRLNRMGGSLAKSKRQF